jgi:putative tributyrin esterase
MALLHCNFWSEVLQLACSMDVILPEPKRSPAGEVLTPPRLYPTLYLLHGLSDDHTIWQRRTSIERYVAEMDLAVVMPAVDRSFYTDMAAGNRYGTFISTEVPALARAMFPLSSAREDNFVAGLSMGGYGAFKLALSHPECFAAAASLSGAVNIAELRKVPDPEWRAEFKRIFGSLRQLPGSRHDLLHLAQEVADSEWKEQLALFQWCGTEDFLYPDNILFRDHALALGLNLVYSEGPGGHTWDMWDAQIQRVLEWLPLARSVEETETDEEK